MDLNPIGRHCALQSCNALDFLPIQCPCLQWFCKLHVSPELHQCSVQQQTPSASPPVSTRPKCAFLGCDKPSLATTAVDPSNGEALHEGACPGCQLSFCVHHRHTQSHACAGLSAEKEDTRHAAARAILAEKFPASNVHASPHTPVVTRQRGDPPPDSQRRAQLRKIETIKLRHRAVPADPKDRGSIVTIDQRFHLIVRLETAGQLGKESALWFRKTTVAGRALDLMVRHFGISHTNSLCLKQLSTEGQVLQNHLKLSEQLEDGSTVILTGSPSST